MAKQKIYLVPHFHYDVAYDKTYEAYLEIAPDKEIKFSLPIEVFQVWEKEG